MYEAAGFHALAIENTHDRPYLKCSVGPEITAAMAVIGAKCGGLSRSRWGCRFWRAPISVRAGRSSCLRRRLCEGGRLRLCPCSRRRADRVQRRRPAAVPAGYRRRPYPHLRRHQEEAFCPCDHGRCRYCGYRQSSGVLPCGWRDCLRDFHGQRHRSGGGARRQPRGSIPTLVGSGITPANYGRLCGCRRVDCRVLGKAGRRLVEPSRRRLRARGGRGVPVAAAAVTGCTIGEAMKAIAVFASYAVAGSGGVWAAARLSGQAGAVHRRPRERRVLGAADRDQPRRSRFRSPFEKYEETGPRRQLRARREGAAAASRSTNHEAARLSVRRHRPLQSDRRRIATRSASIPTPSSTPMSTA